MTSESPIKLKTIELLRVYRDRPTLALRNRIVELNLGLVRREAHHWKTQCQEDYDDLMQVGCIGLIQAIERFDVSRGLAFSSFSLPYIRGTIQHYLRDKSPTVRIPRRWSALRSSSKKVAMALHQELGRRPTGDEVRERLGLSPAEWQEFLLAQQSQSPVSLDAPLQQSEEGSSGSLGDTVPDRQYQSFQLAEEDRIRLQQAMAKLEKRTRQVLEFVFLYDLTQKEAAKQLNVTPLTVCRQVKKGVEQLNKLLKDDDRSSQCKRG
jgi:RNA polymerase sigma-B factor